MGQFSLTHLLLLAILLLIFFGPSKLPQLGQSLGRAIRGFKQGLSGDEEKEAKSQELGHDPKASLPPGQNQHAQSTTQNHDEKDPQRRS